MQEDKVFSVMVPVSVSQHHFRIMPYVSFAFGMIFMVIDLEHKCSNQSSINNNQSINNQSSFQQPIH